MYINDMIKSIEITHDHTKTSQLCSGQVLLHLFEEFIDNIVNKPLLSKLEMVTRAGQEVKAA